jgi:allantoate deiminase
LISWAGHDAGALARVRPVAMLFVPSHGGISHAPGEYTAPEAYRRGVAAFVAAIRDWTHGA